MPPHDLLIKLASYQPPVPPPYSSPSKEISFSANLDVAAGGSFSGSVRAVFAGAAETTVSININLHDIISMAKQLADHIGSEFSSIF